MTDPVTVSPHTPVWRLGRAPNPWAWPAPEYAYGQRWDDLGHAFRTIYAGDTALACYIEVLATFRPGLIGDPDYDDIQVDQDDADHYPTPPPGVIDRAWLTGRLLATAILTGTYCDVTRTATLQALRPALLDTARRAGFPDLDSAALKTAGASGRLLTQTTAAYLYIQTRDGVALYDGVRFTSRHGEEHGLWAVFERPGEDPTSRLITPVTAEAVDSDSADLATAFALLHLTWPDPLDPTALDG